MGASAVTQPMFLQVSARVTFYPHASPNNEATETHPDVARFHSRSDHRCECIPWMALHDKRAACAWGSSSARLARSPKADKWVHAGQP